MAKTARAAVIGLGQSIATGASAASQLSDIGEPFFLADFGLPIPPETRSIDTVGQTFSLPAPGDTLMVDFSLTLGPPANLGRLPAGPVFVRAAIFEFDLVNRILGNFIWDNGTDIAVDVAGFGSGANQTLIFAIETTLEPWREYIAFLTLSGNDPGNPAVQGDIGFAIVGDPGSPPSEGAFFDAESGMWFTGNGFDARFEANFAVAAVIPLPPAGMLLVSGLALFGLARRRRPG